jgi:hypothetical protein
LNTLTSFETSSRGGMDTGLAVHVENSSGSISIEIQLLGMVCGVWYCANTYMYVSYHLTLSRIISIDTICAVILT